MPPLDPAVTFIFHKVTNSLVSYKSDTADSKDLKTQKSVFGHFDMMAYLNETCLYTMSNSYYTTTFNSDTVVYSPLLQRISAAPPYRLYNKTSTMSSQDSSVLCDTAQVHALLGTSERIATHALEALTYMAASRVNETMFMTRKQKYKDLDYVYFSPIDCILIK